MTAMTALEATTFMSAFFDEKQLDERDFTIKTELFGITEMPFSVLVDALTNKHQNLSFLNEVVDIVSKLDISNQPPAAFRHFFTRVAQELTWAVKV